MIRLWLSQGSWYVLLTPQRVPSQISPWINITEPVFQRWSSTAHLHYWREGVREVYGVGGEQPSPVRLYNEAFSSKRKTDCQPGTSIWHAIMSVHLQLAPYAKSTGASLESKGSPLNHPAPNTPVVPVGTGRLPRRETVGEASSGLFLMLRCAFFTQGDLSAWRNYNSFSGSSLLLTSCSPAQHKWGEECLFCGCGFEQLTPC